jgi:hypothetical protein
MSIAEILVEAGHKAQLGGPTKRENSISGAHWSGMTQLMIDYKSMVAFPGYWEDRKHWLSAEFRAYMDTEILPTPPRPGVTIPGSV